MLSVVSVLFPALHILCAANPLTLHALSQIIAILDHAQAFLACCNLVLALDSGLWALVFALPVDALWLLVLFGQIRRCQ